MLPSLQAVQGWDKNEVNRWLGTVGLGKYMTTFSELDIDGEVLVMDLDEELAREEVKMSASHVAFLMDWIEAVKTRRKLRFPYPNAKKSPAKPTHAKRVPNIQAGAQISPKRRVPKSYSPSMVTTSPQRTPDTQSNQLIAQLQMEIQRLKTDHAAEIERMQHSQLTLERRASSAASPAIVMQLQSQIKQLKKSHSEQIATAVEENESMEAEVRVLHQKLKNTSGSPEKLKQLQTHIQGITQSHIQQLQANSTAQQKLQAENTELQVKLQAVTAQLAQNSSASSAHMQEMQSLKMEKTRLQEENRTLQTKLTSVQHEAGSSDKINQLHAQIQGLTAAHMEEIQSIKSQKKNAELEFQMQKAQLTNLQVQLADSESKVLKLENSLGSVNNMFSNMATRFTQAQEGAARMPVLEAQVESLISERDALQKAKSEGDEHLANCETQLASLRTKVDGLTREKTGLSEEIKTLKEKQRTEETALSDRFQAQLTRLIGSIQQKDKEYSQLDSMHNAMIEELTMEQGEAEKIIDELEAKELSQIQEIKRLEQALKDSDKREDSIRQQLSQWKQYQADTDEQKSKQIEMLMEQQNSIEKEHEQYMQTELARRDAEIEKYKQEATKTDEELKSTKADLADKKKQVADLYAESKEAQDKMFKLQDTLLRFMDKLSQKDDEVKQIQAQNEQKVNSLQAQVEVFESEIVERDQFIDELSSNNVKQVENLTQLRHQNEALSSEIMALNQEISGKESEIAHLITQHGNLDAKIQEVMQREQAIADKAAHLQGERERIEKLFQEREAIEMEKRSWAQREQQLQSFAEQVKGKHRDVTEILQREAEVTKREEGLLRRETAIERIEEKQREQIALHMKSIAENQRNLSSQKTELQELEQLLAKRRKQMEEMEKQHQENIRREAAAVEEAGARMKEIDKRLSEREHQLDARDQVLKNKRDDLKLMEKELNHRKKMLEGRELEIESAEENVKFRKNKIDQDERRLYFGSSGEAEQPKNYYVSRTSLMSARPENLGKFKASGARERSVSTVDSQANIYHQMWRVKEAQIRKEGSVAPARQIDRRQTIAVTKAHAENNQPKTPLIAPPNLPKLSDMLDQEEERESSPEAPMVMLLPTAAPVAPPVPVEVRRESMASPRFDEQEGSSVLDKTKETKQYTDEGPDILVGGDVLDDPPTNHPPVPTPQKVDTAHPPAPTPPTERRQSQHPPAPVPPVATVQHPTPPTPQKVDIAHPPAPVPPTERRQSQHPPAPVPPVATAHPPAPTPKKSQPIAPSPNTNSLIAVETRQGIGRLVDTTDSRLMAEFLPNQIWDVDMSSCIALNRGDTLITPYGDCELLAMTLQCTLVVKLQNGETLVLESGVCQSEYRYYYNKCLEDLCFGDKLESNLSKTIPFSFLTDLRFRDVEGKIKITLNQYGQRVFSLRI